MLPWYQLKDNFIINTDWPFLWKEYWASMKSNALALFPNILALFLCCACPFCLWNISGKFIKAICSEGDLFISILSQNNKNPCIYIKMQLFLQPKLFHKGNIIYNIFRGNSQPCLAILQELYRWRIPFFNLNSLTHNKREKQDPRTLSFTNTYYSK